MRALLSTQVGGPETLVLSEIDAPQPGPGEVCVAVHAVGVNYPDTLIIEDRYQFKPPRPFAPGGEISGVVTSIGEGVTNIVPGQRVLGSCGWNGMAEQVVLPQRAVVPLPEGMPFDEAAAFLMTYGTSYYALKQRAQLAAGETLLVLGAAGGVGLAAVELAKSMGARVIAGVSTSEKLSIAMAHGADDGIIYPAGPQLSKEEAKAFSDAIKAKGGGEGVNVVYDAVGGGYAEPAVRAMAWNGRYLVVGFPAGIPSIPLNLTLLKNCAITGVFWGAHVAREPDLHAANVRELFALYGAGKIRPHISARFPLERGAEAITMLAQRRATGKVIVEIPQAAT